MVIYYVAEFLATWLECGIGILAVSEFLTENRENKRLFFISVTVLTTLILGCNQIKLLSLYATVGGIVGIAIISSNLYHIKIMDSLVLSIAYIIIIYIIDFLSISILSLIFNNKYFGMQVIQGYSIRRVCHLFFTKLLLILSYFGVIKKICVKVSLIRRKMWVTIAVFGILVAYFGEKTIKETGNQMLIVWSFISFIIIFCSYVGIQYLEYMKAKEYVKLAEERNMVLAKKYENLIENYRDNQIRNHDLKNHYLIIKELVKNKEFEKLEQYVNTLGDVEMASSSEVWTGVSILDQLLRYKKAEARKKHIHFDIVSDRIELKLSEAEIVALFGNALDNAVESCDTMENNEKWISIRICQVHNMVFIKIMNSAEGELISDKGRLLSKKEDNKMFGWGMLSMQTIVEKYKGSISFHMEDGVFKLVISFFD